MSGVRPRRRDPPLEHIMLEVLRSGQWSALPAGKLALVLAPAPDLLGVGVFGEEVGRYSLAQSSVR
jgi:hypothetical protein